MTFCYRTTSPPPPDYRSGEVLMSSIYLCQLFVALHNFGRPADPT